MSRRDLIRTTASLTLPNGATFPLGEFRTFSGGEITAADVKSVSGAGAIERARGGRRSVGNVTISREYASSDNLVSASFSVGLTKMSVTRQALDENLNAYGASITYTGILIRVGVGEGDNQSDSELDDFELEMSCDGLVS